MIVKYKNNTEESFDVNAWDVEKTPEGTMMLIKRKFDTEGDYFDDDDKDIALINLNEFHSITF